MFRLIVGVNENIIHKKSHGARNRETETETDTEIDRLTQNLMGLCVRVNIYAIWSSSHNSENPFLPPVNEVVGR